MLFSAVPYVSIDGSVHRDDCPVIVPDLDPVRYTSEVPEERSLADCECCRA